MKSPMLPQLFFDLPVSERIALADRLYASVPVDWQQTADRAWLEESECRSAEMDADPDLEISYEAFVAGITVPGAGG